MTLTITPKNKNELKKVKTILRAIDVVFEEDIEYIPEFIEEIRTGEEQIKNGQCTTLKSKDELKKFFGSL